MMLMGEAAPALFLDAANEAQPNICMFLIKPQYLWTLEQLRGKSAISAGFPPARTAGARRAGQISAAS